MPQALELCTPFSDHMVLQRGRRHPLWGWDHPEQAVELVVTLGGKAAATASGRADVHGRFKLTFPELGVGGPYTLTLRGSSAVTLNDVMVGEVWLASGQSNMEFRVAASGNADAEILAADHPEIRVLKVEPRASLCPTRRASGLWQVSSPETAGAFTAVGYFFARDLHRELRVPVGIIDSSWGGTRIEAWISAGTLGKLEPSVHQELAELARQRTDLDRIAAEHAARVRDWEIRALPQDSGNQGELRGWHTPTCDDSGWRELVLPNFWQSCSMLFNGVVWFRRAVAIPEAWAGRDLELGLGPIDDFDHTYFGGTLVGSHPAGTPEAFKIPRVYLVPGHLVSAGKSVLAVRVFDHFGQGGFGGPKAHMYLGLPGDREHRLPLAGPWKCSVEREIPLVAASVFHDCPQPPLALAPERAPGALYNAMIEPLAPFGIRGALWYQGEANVPTSRSYRELLVAMIRDWRTRWGQGQFPFYLVQLAGFAENGLWPWLREAQAQVLSEPSTRMVTALDIGDPNDIHPKNKQEVSRRLSLVALAEVHGHAEIVSRGPELERVDIEADTVRLTWRYADGLQTVDGGSEVRGFELSGPSGHFVPARGRIEGEQVVVACPEVAEPVAVRYAWDDCPCVNLVNRAGLPALPFRTDAEPAKA